MGKFLDLLDYSRSNMRPMTLIASLPRNDPALARAALEGGADVLKVHLNVHHHASGTHFGSLEEERTRLEEILQIWHGRPVGIVPAGHVLRDVETLSRLPEMGFDFLSLYNHHAPVGLLPPVEAMDRMLAFSVDDTPEIMKGMAVLSVQIAELSIMHPNTYGEPFTYQDLARLAAAAKNVHPLPAVLPTQHKVLPQAIPELLEARIAGLMIGIIVAGETPESWEESCRSFRSAIDANFS